MVVAWANKKFGFNSLTDSPLPKLVIQARHRILGRATVNRKFPLEINHRRTLSDKFAPTNLAELQIVTFITLGFVGLFKWNQLSALKVQIISFKQTTWWYSFKKGKTISSERALGSI